MEYFKHFTNAHESKSIMALLDEFGHTGYAAWFMLLEVCAERMQKNQNETYTEAHVLFSFRQRFLKERLRISPTKLRQILDFCQTFDLLSYDFDGENFQIKIPKLLESLDRDQRRARQVRDTGATVARLERRIKNKEYKKEESKNKEYLKTQSLARPAADKSGGSVVWDFYSNEFKKRYGVDPVRNAKTNSQCKQIHYRLGEDAGEVIKFYLTHNDAWYLKRQHDLGSFLQAAESLHTQWQRGQAVTSAQVRQVEKTITNQDTLKQYFEMNGEKNNESN